MITPFDIKSAVNQVLNGKFQPIKVKAQDITKGFIRPSFSTELDDVKIETLESQIETSLIVRAYYFPDLNNTDESLDVLNMQFLMQKTFGNKLNVADRSLNINEPSANVVDGILVFEFNMLFYQETEEDDVPMIDTLIYNGK